MPTSPTTTAEKKKHRYRMLLRSYICSAFPKTHRYRELQKSTAVAAEKQRQRCRKAMPCALEVSQLPDAAEDCTGNCGTAAPGAAKQLCPGCKNGIPAANELPSAVEDISAASHPCTCLPVSRLKLRPAICANSESADKKRGAKHC
jgi:hypothetical protein